MGKNDIEVSIEHCRNIAKVEGGPLLIAKNRVNVFFGANGTGKTTICRVLQYLDETNESLKTGLVSHSGTPDTPEPFAKRNNFKYSTLVFNSQWIEDHCFKGNDLQEGAYALYIRNDEIRKLELRRDRLLAEVERIARSDEFNNLVKTVGEIKRGLGGVTKAGEFSASSPVARAYKNGSPVEDGLPERLRSVVREMNYGEKAEWAKWHKDAPTCVNLALCPYCGVQDGNAVEECRAYDESRSGEAVNGWEKMARMFQNNASLLTKEGRSALNSVLSSPKRPSKEQLARLVDFRRLVEKAEAALSLIASINSNESEPAELIKQLDAAATALGENRIFLKTRNGIETNEQRVIRLLINAIARLQRGSDELDGVTIALEDRMKKAIAGKEGEFDEFLKVCGYRYHIDISASAVAREAHIRLLPEGREQCAVNPGEALSYGEKNALALALFMFVALSDPKALIVLDDPISSFDYDKRYGVLHALLGADTCFERNLRGRTVLLLTHDYLVVQDLIALPGRGGPSVNGQFLSTTKDGVLRARPLGSENILPYEQVLMNKIKESKDRSILIRLVYVRRLCEMRRKSSKDRQTREGVSFGLLSDVVHGRKAEQIKSKIDKGEMGQRAIDMCNAYVSKLLGKTFDYLEALDMYAGNAPLVKEYESGGLTSEEKLILVRLMIERNPGLGKDEPAMKRFADESCHIGGSYLFQLNGPQYSQIPFYVEEWCDRIAAEESEVIKAGE